MMSQSHYCKLSHDNITVTQSYVTEKSIEDFERMIVKFTKGRLSFFLFYFSFLFLFCFIFLFFHF